MKGKESEYVKGELEEKVKWNDMLRELQYRAGKLGYNPPIITWLEEQKKRI